jgi:type II secretory pathway component GspD/PulD (secretin)
MRHLRILFASLIVAAGTSASAKTGNINIKWESLPVEQAALAVADMLGEAVTVDPGVRGTITISAEKLTPDQVLDLYRVVLNWNGATIVKDDAGYSVLPCIDACE